MPNPSPSKHSRTVAQAIAHAEKLLFAPGTPTHHMNDAFIALSKTNDEKAIDWMARVANGELRFKSNDWESTVRDMALEHVANAGRARHVPIFVDVTQTHNPSHVRDLGTRGAYIAHQHRPEHVRAELRAILHAPFHQRATHQVIYRAKRAASLARFLYTPTDLAAEIDALPYQSRVHPDILEDLVHSQEVHPCLIRPLARFVPTGTGTGVPGVLLSIHDALQGHAAKLNTPEYADDVAALALAHGALVQANAKHSSDMTDEQTERFYAKKYAEALKAFFRLQTADPQLRARLKNPRVFARVSRMAVDVAPLWRKMREPPARISRLNALTLNEQLGEHDAIMALIKRYAKDTTTESGRKIFSTLYLQGLNAKMRAKWQRNPRTLTLYAHQLHDQHDHGHTK